jgi:hypothetical protein
LIISRCKIEFVFPTFQNINEISLSNNLLIEKKSEYMYRCLGVYREVKNNQWYRFLPSIIRINIWIVFDVVAMKFRLYLNEYRMQV